MRNRIWTLLFCIHCLGLAAAAQNPAKSQLVLQVSNGGFIAFSSETSAADSKHVPESKSLADLIYSQALADENRIIHRVLMMHSIGSSLVTIFWLAYETL